MPSVTVHLRLADRVLDYWRTRGVSAPFSPGDQGAVNAFLHGSFGPDLGLFPGGHQPLSDLSHSFRSGDLCRALLNRARTAQERAFAWGWVTHVLADTLIHPLVGCAVGELRYGSASRFVDGDSDPVTHVRVEAGLDALYALRHPEIRRFQLSRVFTDRTISFLVGAYEDTYGVRFDTRHFIRSHRVSARRAMQGVALATLAATTMPDSPAQDGREPGPVRALRSLVSRQAIGLAFLLPAPPSLWFINAVRDVEETFVDLFLEEFALEGSGLANVNLDTGRPDLSETGHGALTRSLSLLAGMSPTDPHRTLAVTGAA